MSVAKLREDNRKAEMKAVCQFIDTCDFDEIATIIEEIRCVHDNLYAFCPTRKFMAKIESVCINGESIQLNIE